MDKAFVIETIYGAIGPEATMRVHVSSRQMDLIAEAARLRAEAEARPLRLPVNRRVDERHLAVTDDGLRIWFTLQVSAHSRIWEALFERNGRAPSDEECRAWLSRLLPGQEAVEAYALPGAGARRFEIFERSPEAEAPLS